MTRTSQLLGAVSAFALVAMSSSPALAVGTQAGDSITNNVSVTFQVGGEDQNAEVDSDTFVVDRKIDVLVNFTGTSNTSVSPGEDNAVLAFDVTNLSNDIIDMNLGALLTGGTGDSDEIGLDDGAGNITAGSFEIYIDLDGDGILDANELSAGPVTSLDNVSADDTGNANVVSVLVVADFSTDVLNDDTFDVTLTASALNEDGSAITGTLGSGDANTAAEDTIFGDGAGATDAAGAGDFSDTGTYEVAGAVIDVVKSSRIISDPVNDTTNPKAIPGAVIEYCIAVSNGADAATATSVNVADDLPADVTFLASGPDSIGIVVDGTATVDTSGATPVATCSGGADGVPGGTASFTAGGGTGGLDLVSGTLSDIPLNTTRSVYFRVTIN